MSKNVDDPGTMLSSDTVLIEDTAVVKAPDKKKKIVSWDQSSVSDEESSTGETTIGSTTCASSDSSSGTADTATTTITSSDTDLQIKRYRREAAARRRRELNQSSAVSDVTSLETQTTADTATGTTMDTAVPVTHLATGALQPGTHRLISLDGGKTQHLCVTVEEKPKHIAWTALSAVPLMAKGLAKIQDLEVPCVERLCGVPDFTLATVANARNNGTMLMGMAKNYGQTHLNTASGYAQTGVSQAANWLGKIDHKGLWDAVSSAANSNWGWAGMGVAALGAAYGVRRYWNEPTQVSEGKGREALDTQAQQYEADTAVHPQAPMKVEDDGTETAQCFATVAPVAEAA